MDSSVVSRIEESISELPTLEQRQLIDRVAKTLRDRESREFSAKLIEMARDPDVIREMQAIEREFLHTELDGLAK